MATTEHNSKHASHNPFSHNTTSYADHHKHFHANTSAVPTGFHLPHHASTTPNLTTIKTNSSDSDNNDDQPTFPPQPPKPHHHATFIHHHHNNNNTTSEHPSPQQPQSHHENYLTHHHHELSLGRDARHAKHDASHSASQQMPSYQQDRSAAHLTKEEEIALFKRQEAERRRLLEEQKEVDRKSWDEIVLKRERARRTSGAAYDVVERLD